MVAYFLQEEGAEIPCWGLALASRFSQVVLVRGYGGIERGDYPLFEFGDEIGPVEGVVGRGGV